MPCSRTPRRRVEGLATGDDVNPAEVLTARAEGRYRFPHDDADPQQARAGVYADRKYSACKKPAVIYNQHTGLHGWISSIKPLPNLNDLFRSMTPGARITAGLLLAVVVISLGYLFSFQVSSTDTYLMNGRSVQARRVRPHTGCLGREKPKLQGGRDADHDPQRRRGQIYGGRGRRGCVAAELDK